MKNRANKERTTNWNKSNIICGECVCPIPECPWMSRGRPVPGWDAELVVIKFSGKKNLTYSIKHCPLFVPHPKSKLFKMEANS